MSITADQNATVARRVFEEVCTGCKRELAEDLMTPDYRSIDPRVHAVEGPQGMADTVAVFQTGVDGHWGVEEILPAGEDRVVVRWTGTGTRNAEVMGLPPTGKAVRVDVISVLRFRDGMIAEHRCVWDTVGFLQQLGVVLPSAQPTG